jgi:hypothetical protein
MNIIAREPSNILSKRKSKFAIASITLGIFSIFIQLLLIVDLIEPIFLGDFISTTELILIIFAIMSSILALSFGIVALGKILHSNILGGKCFAIAGIIFGCEVILGVILFFITRY